MGRLSNAEKARRAEEQARHEAEFQKMMALRKAEEERMKPHLDYINNILDNIDLGDYSNTWNDKYTQNDASYDGIWFCSGSFGGKHNVNMTVDQFFRIVVSYDRNKKDFVANVSQCRMGDLDDNEIDQLIEETNNLKGYLATIKAATDKVLEYVKANNLEIR